MALIALGSSVAFCISSPERGEPTNYPLRYNTSGDANDSSAGLEATAKRVQVDRQSRVTIANVRLRMARSSSSQVVLTVPTGTSVFSTKEKGKWHFVSYGDHSGWMFADLLIEKTSYVSPISVSRSDRERGLPSSSDHQALIGRATVVDGDTIEIAGTRVRLNGIDAPESGQLCQDAEGRRYRCGQKAAKVLDAWLQAAHPVTCNFIEWDRYGRFVGDCSRADGASVAAWLVGAGYALDWPLYSGGVYAGLQTEARDAKRGIWQGDFQVPWEWRAARRAAIPEVGVPPKLMSNSCNIKGNINSKGIRIYHVPGQRYYDETVISPRKGERMFCTEDDARAAGWRRSRQ